MAIVVALPMSDQVWLVRLDDEEHFRLPFLDFAKVLRAKVTQAAATVLLLHPALSTYTDSSASGRSAVK